MTASALGAALVIVTCVAIACVVLVIKVAIDAL